MRATYVPNLSRCVLFGGHAAYKRGGGILFDSKGKQGAGRIARGKHEINLGETTKLRSRAHYRILAHSNKVKWKNLSWIGVAHSDEVKRKNPAAF